MSETFMSLLNNLKLWGLLPPLTFADETRLTEHIERSWTASELHSFCLDMEQGLRPYPADVPPSETGMSYFMEGKRPHYAFVTPEIKSKLERIFNGLWDDLLKAQKELAALAKDGDGAAYDGHYYYTDCKLLGMTFAEVRETIERVKKWNIADTLAEVKDTMLKRGDLKKDQRYKVAKQHGSDGRKPLKKEIADRLGLSRPALDALLKKPDNEWGLTTDCIQSWQAFDYYCETHKNIIDQHKANPKSKIRKPRAKLVLTKTGDMGNQSQSATQNYKPHGRTTAKPKG